MKSGQAELKPTISAHGLLIMFTMIEVVLCLTQHEQTLVVSLHRASLH